MSASVVVPITPTPGMVRAGLAACTGYATAAGVKGAWKAMLESAPKAKPARPPTDAHLREWAYRHDIQGSLVELRLMVEDAATLARAAP